MGTHLVNTTSFLAGGTFTDGTQSVSASSAAQCAALCDDDNNECIGATFIYDVTLSTDATKLQGRCLKYLRNPTGGAYSLYVKVLPLDYLSGASSNIQGAAAVASGHYVKWSPADLQHGRALEHQGSTLPIVIDVEACKDICDNKAACWGFYYGGGCMLRTGFSDAEGHRTFFHAYGPLIE